MEGENINNNTSPIQNFNGGSGMSNPEVLADASAELNASPLSSVEARQLSSEAPTSFTEMLEGTNGSQNTIIDLNLPYVAQSSSSNFTTDHILDRGQKRKSSEESSSEQQEDSQMEQLECQCQVTPVQQNTPESNPSSSSSRRSVRRRASNFDIFIENSQSGAYQNWLARTTVTRVGEIHHSMRAIGGQQPALNSAGTSSSSSSSSTTRTISILGHAIPRPTRPTASQASETSNIDSARSVLVQENPRLIGAGRVNEGGNTSAVVRNLNNVLLRLSADGRRRGLIEQALDARNNAPVQVQENVPTTISMIRAGHDHGPTSSRPAVPQQNFVVHRQQGINLAVVLQFDNIINLQDEQENMRLDVDDMSYEELIQLQEQIGVINNRLSPAAILDGLNRRKHRSGKTKTHEEQEICCICLDELGNGEDLAQLDCMHQYHFDCIKQWLEEKNSCPICKKIAIPTGEQSR